MLSWNLILSGCRIIHARGLLLAARAGAQCSNLAGIKLEMGRFSADLIVGGATSTLKLLLNFGFLDANALLSNAWNLHAKEMELLIDRQMFQYVVLGAHFERHTENGGQ